MLINSNNRIIEWFSTPLGVGLVAAENERLATIVPQLYSPIAVQLGPIDDYPALGDTAAATRVQVGIGGTAHVGAKADVMSSSAALPFAERSVDLALLPHSLDFCDEPHQLLREIATAIVPGGHIAIVGFNPMSLWGVWRVAAKWSRRAPWCGAFFRLSRVQDWLALLGFEVTSGSLLYYRPPLQNAAFRARLAFIEPSGARWWPYLAAVYIVVARKREFGMTPVLGRAGRRRRLTPQLARSATTARTISAPKA